MSAGRLGTTVVIDDSDKVTVVFTDGTCACPGLEKRHPSQMLMRAIKTPGTLLAKTMRASDVLSVMNENGISELLIIDYTDRLEAIITLHDFSLQAGVKIVIVD